MLFVSSPGMYSRVEVSQNIDRGGGGVFGYNVPQFFPIVLSMFVMLWSLVRCIGSDEGRVVSPGSDLNFDNAVRVRDNCCYIWSKMWCDYDPYSRTFCFA